MTNIIEVKKLNKIYCRGCESVHALNNATFSVKKGEIVSIIGPSGSGKTTLVNILGCLDNPTSGSVKIDGQEIFKKGSPLSEVELTKIRRKFFGYIFQRFFLIPTLTVYENIVLPFAFYKAKHDEKDIQQIMTMLDIAKRKDHLPFQLSGGEMQRVTIARALVNSPSILLADEPTGNLDTKRLKEIKALFLKLNKERGITIVLVTHNPDLADIGHKVIKLKDGVIQKR